MSPFDIAKHLNTKAHIDVEEALSEYGPWMINVVLSNHQQTVLFSNEMNKHYDLSKEQQYMFYFHGIPKGSRFSKWNKKESEFSTTDIEIVCELFDINKKMAEKYLSMMSDDQLNIIRTAKGGNHGRSTN